MKIIELFITVMAIVFACRVVKRIFTKYGNAESIDKGIDKAAKGVADGGKAVFGYFKKKVKEKEEKPIVTIR